ncbi:MAG: hypothetical protein Q9193_005878 [Seirophora villosa]
MDPLSITASIITVLHVANKAIKFLLRLHNAPQARQELVTELRRTRDVLEDLAKLASETEEENDPATNSMLPTLNRLTKADSSPLAGCRQEIEALSTKLAPTDLATEGSKVTKRKMQQAFIWAFGEKEISKVLSRLEGLRQQLSHALEVDQTRIVVETHKKVDTLTSRTTAIHEDARHKTIFQWLGPPDNSLNFTEACRKRQESTGEWFLKNQQYADWQAQPNTLIWLHGIPGCGKTILSSTIIEDLYAKDDGISGQAVAHFFFNHSTTASDCYGPMLRSLVVQISRQNPAALKLTEDLFLSHGKGARQPTNKALLAVLRDMIRSCPTMYLVLDALDECTSRPELLRAIRTINAGQLTQLHMLVTSRRERDIIEALSAMIEASSIINIQSSLISGDIRTYIRSRLSNDVTLKRWRSRPEVQEKIERKLMEKADGMFRWVECQLDILQHCLFVRELEKALESLPQTLHETYERILCTINKSHERLAIKALQWLLYSRRPLTVQELAEVLAIDVEAEPRFDVNSRLADDDDVISVCSSLITITQGPDEWHSRSYWWAAGEPKNYVRFAHFSVKEYLTSRTILDGPAARYAAGPLRGHITIAEDCISYVLQLIKESNAATEFTGVVSDTFPLAEYAVSCWMEHAMRAGQKQERVFSLLCELFLAEASSCDWLPNVKRRAPWEDDIFDGPVKDAPSRRLPYAAQLGMPRLIDHLIRAGFDLNVEDRDGYTALQMAVNGEHLGVVKSLLEHGADIQAGRPTALMLAACGCNSTIASLLISEGASVNVINERGPRHFTALISAVEYGNMEMVMALVAAGAEINTYAGALHRTAIFTAVFDGSENIVRWLLDAGADPNITAGCCPRRHALSAAASEGHMAVLRLLVERGADVNAEDFIFGTALYAASRNGQDQIVRLLLDKGADVNKDVSREYADALVKEATVEGTPHESQPREFAQDAEANRKDGRRETALMAASYRGRETVVRILLRRGAHFHLQAGVPEQLLGAACTSGNLKLVQLFLENGANLDTLLGRDKSLLQAASRSGSVAVVQFLLDRGAEVNAQGKPWGSPLQAALEGGNEAVPRLLLDNGADVNLQGGERGGVRQAALFHASIDLVHTMFPEMTDDDIRRDVQASVKLKPHVSTCTDNLKRTQCLPNAFSRASGPCPSRQHKSVGSFRLPVQNAACIFFAQMRYRVMV